jgi:squalene synthase HpnC
MDTITSSDLETAYLKCEKLARTHYENFPVASILLPKALRRPIAVIYAFARMADDIADEGTLPPSERLQQLDYYWQALENIEKIMKKMKNEHSSRNEYSVHQKPTAMGETRDPLFIALQDILEKHPELPINLLFDLLRAFRQDVVKQSYDNFEEILTYCRYSANPIGRLLLHLFHQATPENLADSDAICTALQLINFLQDLHDDLVYRHRCYLPQDEMSRLNINKEQLIAQQNTDAIQQLITQQLLHAEQLFDKGNRLGKRLTGRFGFEIRLITVCGYQLIHALKKRKNVYSRPVIHFWHWPLLVWKAL